MQDFLINISLMNINGAMYSRLEDPYTGKEKLYVCLPVDDANILINKQNYSYMSFYARHIVNPTAKRTHFLNPVMSKENLEKAKQMGFVKTRYIGKMYPVAERKY